MIIRKMLIFITTFYWFFVEVLSIRCNKIPKEVSSSKSHPHGKLRIEIAGNPERYVPKQAYTISLVSETQFREFLLTVETEGGDVAFPDPLTSSTGRLELGDDMLTRFSDKCPNAIMQTNNLPKTEAKVIWIAPDSQSGCVFFRATVVESPRVWYSEEGSLEKKLCEDDENENSQPNILSYCCACSEAKYEVTFEGLWSRNTHPKDYPDNKWSTRFSDVIGASHSVGYSFWNYGELANEGLRQMVENGNTRELEKELKDNSIRIRTIIKARGISYPNITGKTFAVFRVDNIHHLMSLVSMIFPSPDWFVGISNLELCLKNCSWIDFKMLNLYPIDAGTDEGITYLDRNRSPEHPMPIRQIKSNNPNHPDSPFYDESGEPMKPFARIYLSRQRLYEKGCVNDVTHPSVVDCEYGEWGDWSPCSVTCGRGTKYKQRTLKNGDPERCLELTTRSSCRGIEDYCRISTIKPGPDEMCELTEWGNWSSCSEKCGRGIMTRSRRYKYRTAAKRCAAGIENPPPLEQNLECTGEEKDCQDTPKTEDCPEIPWSHWSPCLTSCGRGLKVRNRVFDKTVEVSAESSSTNEQIQDRCANIKRIETVECTHDERPECKVSTSQEPNGSIIESYSQIVTDEQTSTENKISSESQAVDCEVSPWSEWEPCSVTCGEGIKIRTRMIKVFPTNGGKQCGDLIETQECKVKCHGGDKRKRNKHGPTPKRQKPSEELCEMSKWSAWTPCTQPCGIEAVQQRTRAIINRNTEYGEPCSLRLQERNCNLLPCNSDFETFNGRHF